MAPVISAKDLYKCYPGFPPVLRGVNIDVEPGEMVAIMGPSGCGKSTMLHVLGMLHAPDSGSLEILGKNVLVLNSEGTAAFRRGNMGFVMQASNLFDHSTVFENVEFPLIYENIPPQERWERVIRALDLVRLSKRVHYRSNRLSGGEQQRVAIARAMVNNPRILLADEPTGALDARTSRVIMENFRNLCHKGGVAMVMVTHDPKMAEYCDSIYTLEDGILVCKKHEPPRLELDGHASFLDTPEPLVAGALVAWRFPMEHNPVLLELARRFNDLHLLSRIYALRRNGVFAGQGGYSLPLAVRRIGFWQRIFGSAVLWRRARGSLWGLWRLLPRRPGFARMFRRLGAFISGVILARWALADKIQFLYVVGAREAASAAWVAARLGHLPFAFAVSAQDIPRLGKDVAARAQSAAFVTYSTPAVGDAFMRLAPDLPANKLFLLPNPPLFATSEDDNDIAPMAGQPASIVCMGVGAGSPQLVRTLKAAQLLKKRGLAFRLTILGPSSFRLRWKLRTLGLGKLASFTGNHDDSLSEVFRTANIFMAWPPAGRSLELELPWQLTEAMAFGNAIVVAQISSGMACVLRAPENCIVAAEPDEIADVFEKLITQKNAAEKLGAAAKRDIRAFLDMEKRQQQLAQLISDAVRNNQQKGGEREL